MLTDDEKKQLAELQAKQNAQPEQKPVEKSKLDTELENAKKELELKKIKKEMEQIDKPEKQQEDPNAYTFTINGDAKELEATDADYEMISKLIK